MDKKTLLEIVDNKLKQIGTLIKSKNTNACYENLKYIKMFFEDNILNSNFMCDELQITYNKIVDMLNDVETGLGINNNRLGL